jgi:hypothetical protein
MFTRATLCPTALLAALAGLAAPAAAQCPPNNPTGLVVSGLWCGEIHLNWNDVTGATLYNVYRNTTNSYSSSGWLGSNVVSQFTDLTAQNGVTYYYWVTATRALCLPGSNVSGPSNVASGHTGQSPAAPTAVSAVPDCGAVRIRWTNPPTVLGGPAVTNRIYRSLVNVYALSAQVGQVGPTETSYLDLSANGGTTYYYWVGANNACGTSAGASVTGSWTASSPPANNTCANPTLVTSGALTPGSTICATATGSATCGASSQSPDVWYAFAASSAGTLRAQTCNSAGSFDTVISIHSGCPGTIQNQIACNDNSCGALSLVDAQLPGPGPYYIRVAGHDGDRGTFTLRTDFTASTCYANCDGSSIAPVLNVLDFNCFLNKFAAGNAYANCDGSSVAPVLNVLDFNCFLNKFAAGCP